MEGNYHRARDPSHPCHYRDCQALVLKQCITLSRAIARGSALHLCLRDLSCAQFLLVLSIDWRGRKICACIELCVGGWSERLEGEASSGWWGRCSTRTRQEKGFKYLVVPCGIAIAGLRGE